MTFVSRVVGAGIILLSTACCAVAQAPAPSEPEAPKVTFDVWLADLREEALAKGITEETFDTALSTARPISRIIELDRNQPEFKLTFREYLTRTVPKRRVDTGRRLLRENKEILEEVAAVYKVQPRFLVAFWGIESDFGRITGDFQCPMPLRPSHMMGGALSFSETNS